MTENTFDTRTDVEKLREADEHLRSLPCVRPISRDFDRITTKTGEISSGVASIPCGTAYQSLCPPCAARKKRDVFLLALAGTEGLFRVDADGQPTREDVYHEHSFLFLTLTLPGFGAVHRQRGCPCGHTHGKSDDVVGLPIDPDAYDYSLAAASNAAAPRLWNRTLEAIKRTSDGPIDYFGSAEFQVRGSIHYHLLLRSPGLLDPDAILRAAHGATTYSGKNRTGLRIRWGDQIDAQLIDPSAGEHSKIISYAAKALAYTVKDHGEDAGLTYLAHRRHLRRLEQEADRLQAEGIIRGTPPEQERHGSGAGFRGHRLLKSRGWTADPTDPDRPSPTFSSLQQARVAYAREASGQEPGAYEYEWGDNARATDHGLQDLARRRLKKVTTGIKEHARRAAEGSSDAA